MKYFPLLIFITSVLACTSTTQSQEKSGSFKSNGVKISYSIKGKGQPVVFIHGLTGKKEQYNEFREKFVDSFQVITMDVRGHGASDKPEEEGSYGLEMVHDVSRLLDHLKIKKADIVSYSMGADIANKFREMYPNRIRKCVLGGVGLGVDKGWADEPLDITALADSLKTGNGFEPLLKLSGAIHPGVADAETIKAFNKSLTQGQNTKALGEIVRSYTVLELSETKTKTNQIQTLIVLGEKDAENKSAHKLHSVLPKSKLVEIKGANHFQAPARPEFVKAILDFLKS